MRLVILGVWMAAMILVDSPARASAQETPPAGASEQLDPHWVLMSFGVSLFTTGYVGGSTAVFASERMSSCGTSDPHSTPCGRRDLAFVPFAHYMGGGDIVGYIGGILATVMEGVGLILTIIGAAIRRPRHRTPRPNLGVTVGGPGADVGLGLWAAF